MADDIETIELYRVSATATPIEPTTELAEIGVLVGLLDTVNYDQLYVEKKGRRTRYGMSGGADGVVTFFVVDGDETYQLTRGGTEAGDAHVLVSSGGQETDVLERWCVPVDRAARALYHHLLTGELDPALTWDDLARIDFDPERR